MGGWEVGRLAVNVPYHPFGTPMNTFRVSIPEAWEVGRLGGWRLTYLKAHLEPLYIPLEPRFLRPGRLGGWEAGWEAGWLAGRLAGSELTYLAARSEPLCIPLEPRFLRPGRLGGWLAVC